MGKTIQIACLSVSMMLLLGLSGCISVPFEVAGSVIEATGSVAEAIVEVPFDTMGAVIHIPASFKATLTEEQEFVFDEEEIERIDLENRNGTVIIRGSDRRGVIVRVKKTIYARTNSRAEKLVSELQIHTNLRNGGLEIYSVPKHMPEKEGCELICYEIDTPNHLNLDIRVNNAPVEISTIEGDIRVDSHNGRISLDGCSGGVYVCTNNGDVRADIEQLWNKGEFISHNGALNVGLKSVTADVNLETYNGSAELRIPVDFSGKLDAQTGNGDLNTEIPVRVLSPHDHQLIGDLGDGNGPKIKIQTHNGSVRIVAIPRDSGNQR